MRFIFLFFLIIITAASAEELNTRTYIRISKGKLAVETGFSSEVMSKGDTYIIDSSGRIFTKLRHREKYYKADKTLIAVTYGSITANGIRLQGGEEIIVSGSDGKLRIDTGTIRRETLKLLGIFEKEFKYTRVSGITADAEGSVIRIISQLVERLEKIEIDEAFQTVWYSAKLSGRPFRDYAETLLKISDRLKQINASIVLMNMEQPANEIINTRFVASLDLHLMNNSVVNVAGTGRLSFRKYGETWFIDGGSISAYDVSSDELPSEFIELRDSLQ